MTTTVNVEDYIVSLATVAGAMGVIGAIFHVVSMAMKTAIPLRIAAIISASFLMAAATLLNSAPAIALYSFLLLVHSVRLFQMLQLIKKIRAAATTDLSLNWLRPYMKKRRYRMGDMVFRKDDPAREMFLIDNGRFRVCELDIELQPGMIFGELGLLTSGNNRTQSVECIESGYVMTLPYDEVRALYFENPEFGFFFLRLSSDRLLQGLKRTEAMLVEERRMRCSQRDARSIEPPSTLPRYCDLDRRMAPLEVQRPNQTMAQG
jgi:CRP-like cAMP-binding protein